MKSYKDIPYKKTDLNECILDVHLPDADVFPVYIYFHGGGLESCDKVAEGNAFIKPLVNKGVAVVSANYRMYPNAAYPDFICDAAAAVAWALEHMKEYGNPTSFFAGGSSAGAYLSQMICFDKKYLNAYGINADVLDGYVHDAGQPTVHYNVLRERGIDTRRVVIDESSSIYHITDKRDYPPMLIVVSDNDMPNRLEQTTLLVSTLKQFGCGEDKINFVIMKDSTHCSYVNKLNADATCDYADMIYNFIKNTNSFKDTEVKSTSFN